MQSSIYFNDLTVIDFSVISPMGLIVGNAATLNLEVSGPVDGQEGVVLDFSAGKKQIKELIDGVGGFDHKCWVNVADPEILISTDEDTTTVRHRTSGLCIVAEHDAFAFVGASPEQDITDFLNEKMAPFVISNVSLNSSVIPVPFSSTEPAVFRYVHGLKYSTSYGCKNLVHGHKSYISAKLIDSYPNAVEAANVVLRGIAKELDCVVFAHSEDVKSTANGTYIVEYSTPERGEMTMTFSQKFIVLETQTTVEHLVEYIRARYYYQLIAVGVKELYVSEGLCKGAKVVL